MTPHGIKLDGGETSNSANATVSLNDAKTDSTGRLAMRGTENSMINGSIQRLKFEVQELSEKEACPTSTKQLMVRLEKLRKDVVVLKQELEAYKDVDPRKVEQKREEIIAMRAEAERWTNNVAILESWLRREFGIDEQQMDHLRRSSYGTELVETQIWAEESEHHAGGRHRSHREVIIVLVRRYVENSRLITGYYERNILPILGDLGSKKGNRDPRPLLERGRFLTTLYHLKTLAVIHEADAASPPNISTIQRSELIDLAEVASWLRRRAHVQQRIELGVHHLLADNRWLQDLRTSFSAATTNHPRTHFDGESEAMDLIAPPSLPFARRDAYEPRDASAYLKLHKLRCIQAGTDILGPHDPLCSLCKEVLLGEPLIDGDGQNTEYRIAFYELPCRHLRCCSCALKWLDSAGIFHHICHYCDSQKLNIKPDLSAILDDADGAGEPDMSWITGFPKKKRSKSLSPTQYSPIYLPTIAEIGEYDDADAAHDVDISTLALQTPAKKRKMNPETPRVASDEGIPASRSPDQFQWTPVARAEADIGTAFENGVAPEAGFDYDENAAETSNGTGSPQPRSATREKERRLFRWTCRGARTCDCCIHDFEDGEGAPSYEEFFEEEQRIRKKPSFVVYSSRRIASTNRIADNWSLLTLTAALTSRPLIESQISGHSTPSILAGRSSKPVTRRPQPTEMKEGLPAYQGGVFTSKVESTPKRASMPKSRGIVGADPGELKIREAARRRKAFDKECYEAGDDGSSFEYENVDEKEMEELLEEMRYLEGGKTALTEGDGGRKKSFAARLLSRG
ncbi:MAG: hypothetical protein Q9211_004098 [Gyalolechia sp. 1 TL-2023]